MTEMELKIRTRNFAVNVMNFVDQLSNRRSAYIIGNQLGRCASAIAANYRAACRARSHAEFISKIGIVEEEADESTFWLNIIIDTQNAPKEIVIPLLNESRELTAIFTASSKTAKKKTLTPKFPNFPFPKFPNSHMSQVKKEVKKVTTHTLQKMKAEGEKVSMITAYDFSFARLFDEAGIDVILVGDSASNVMAGHETTLPITLDQMIYHASSVIRGINRCLVVVDLPFGTYQSNSKEALHSAIRIMKETGAHAVKLEGGEEIIESVKLIVAAGIPVMGHLGLTPQSIYKFGTYTVRAREEAEANKLRIDAKLLQEAGCFAMVLEKIPAILAKEVSESLIVPTIGIGAGRFCDGQVLVMHDLLGINTEFKPRFLRQYLNMHEQVTGAVKHYIEDVKSRDFPNEKEQY